jgi:hypothetical protein
MPIRISKKKSKFSSEKDSFRIIISVNFTPTNASDIHTANAIEAGIFSMAFEKKIIFITPNKTYNTAGKSNRSPSWVEKI